jgi:hypothetical protein
MALFYTLMQDGQIYDSSLCSVFSADPNILSKDTNETEFFLQQQSPREKLIS